jgi:hypothetical protein
MKKIVTTPVVDIEMRTLDDNNRRRVHAWFKRLANWDRDALVRSHSHRLESMPDVYLLKTRTLLWIFFKMDGNTVTIIDIANKNAVLAFGNGSGAEK